MRRILIPFVMIGALFLGALMIAAPASAATIPLNSSCTANGGNPAGFSDPTTERSTSVTYGGRTLPIELRSGDSGGVQYAWSRISNARRGDAAWIDISEDSGRTHAQCGFTTSPGTGQWWTDGFRTSASASTVMRACGGIAIPGGWFETCTNWW